MPPRSGPAHGGLLAEASTKKKSPLMPARSGPAQQRARPDGRPGTGFPPAKPAKTVQNDISGFARVGALRLVAPRGVTAARSGP